MQPCLYVCKHMDMYVFRYACTHVCTCKHVFMYACMSVCVCMYVYIHMHTHVMHAVHNMHITISNVYLYMLTNTLLCTSIGCKQLLVEGGAKTH